MVRFSRKKIQPVYMAIDLFLATIAFFVPYVFKYNSIHNLFININLPNTTEYCFVFALEVIFIISTFKSKHLYGTDRELTIPREFARVIICVFYTSIVVGSTVFFAHYLFFSRFVFIVNIALLVLLLGGWRILKRLIMRKLIREGFHNINILIVGTGKVSELIVEEIKQRPYLGFNIVGFLDDTQNGYIDGKPVLGKLSDFSNVAKKYFVDNIIITMLPERKVIAELMEQMRKMQLGVMVVPEYFEGSLPVVDVNCIGVVPVLTYNTRKPHPSEAVSKRAFDFFVSLALIVLLSPLLLIIAVLIKLSSAGPVFFCSKRVGMKGINFDFYKFRSMVENADELKDKLLEQNEVDKVMFKIKKDPRVTKLGRFMRMYSLDELPQLFNVLIGNMSLVGPRPPLPDEVEKYGSDHIDRLSIKPGITGLSQIRGRSDLSFSRWVRWDLWYINNWSFGLDLKILLETIPVVLKGKGAY
jgi:exopolysaccharide biosynthesis polyprenyl glycosylphosphotransferase